MLTDRRNGAVRVLAGSLLSLLLCGDLAGCGVAYLAQATQGQWRLMRARRPIDQVLRRSCQSDATEGAAELVQDARDFASSALALPDNRSYRSYSDLERPYVVWNVVAAPEFSVNPLRWCFPFTGCLSYRGYFHEQRARAFAAGLAARGNDTLVAGVTAYSTLGHFADPVLNTMMRYGDLETGVDDLSRARPPADLRSRARRKFNESFAVTVEQEGLRRWLAARGRSAELAEFQRRRDADRQFMQVLATGRAALDALYHQPLSVEVMRSRKRALLAGIGDDVRALEQQLHWRSGYDSWIDAGLNNAHLASIATYSDCVPGFQQLLARNGGDLPAFYAAVRRLKRDRDGRRALCRQPALPATAAPTPSG